MVLQGHLDLLESQDQQEEEVCLDLMDQEDKKDPQVVEE